MVAASSTSEETRAFYRLLDEFANLPQGSPGRLILDGDGITTVPIFVQVPDQYFMDMRHDVVTVDSAGVETTKNQLLQYVKRISLTWLKSYLIEKMNENSKFELDVDELDCLKLKDFNRFGCQSVRPKLTLWKPIHPPFLVASSSATKCQTIAKNEQTQFPIIPEDISHVDKTDLESPRLVPTVHHVQEVTVPKSMPRFLVQEESFVEERKMVVSMLDLTIATDDDISLAGNHDKEDNAQEFVMQGQVEIHSMEASYSQCKTSSRGVTEIVTSDDLAPDIGIQGISDSAVRGATGNDTDTIGNEEDEEQNSLTCNVKSDALVIIGPSIPMVKAEMRFKHSIDPQDPSTFVLYELFTKFSPCVKMPTCEAHKTDPGNELCKHGVEIVTTDDLSPDIDYLKISDYQDKVIADDSDAGKQGVDADQQLHTHVTQCKLLPSSDIQWVLAIQQSQKMQKFMLKNPGKTKKIVTIDGFIYITEVYNGVYFTSMHQADKQETPLVYGANEGMTIADMMVIKRGENDVMANSSDDFTAQDLPICAVVAQVHPYKRSTVPIVCIAIEFLPPYVPSVPEPLLYCPTIVDLLPLHPPP